MSERTITLEVDGHRGRYVLREGGHGAEMTYSEVSKTKVVADHTGVDQALRGTGAGLALLERMVTDARAKGFRIVPQCPFIEEMRRRHPDWADVFTA